MKFSVTKLILLVLLVACQPALPPLNSERIEARFGSYGVALVEQGQQRRVSCLYSVENGGRRCRTLAVVRLADDVPAALSEPLDAIRAGASLGATLTAAGWQVVKTNRHLGSYRLPADPDAAIATHFALKGGESLALHIYDLAARRGDAAAHVARLLEIHDPAYLSPEDLLRIYSELPHEPLAPDELEGWIGEAARIPSP